MDQKRNLNRDLKYNTNNSETNAIKMNLNL